MRFAYHRMLVAAAAAALLASTASAAPDEIGATTRLRRCGAETCLLVSGRRADARAPVLLAGHEVDVTGKRAWRVALPLDTVRSWSAPFARSIVVEVGGPTGGRTEARLPIGLLGHVVDLAFLDVRAPY